MEHLTPEAKEQGRDLLLPDAQVYVIDDAELERVQRSYPLVWKNPDAKPKLCFIGCPHLSMEQLVDWTVRLEEGLKAQGRNTVAIPTVFTTAPGVSMMRSWSGCSAAIRLCGKIPMPSPSCASSAAPTCPWSSWWTGRCAWKRG